MLRCWLSAFFFLTNAAAWAATDPETDTSRSSESTERIMGVSEYGVDIAQSPYPEYRQPKTDCLKLLAG
jgi:hypothetical protein